MHMLPHQYFDIDAASMLTWGLTDCAAAQFMVHLGDCLSPARIIYYLAVTESTQFGGDFYPHARGNWVA